MRKGSKGRSLQTARESTPAGGQRRQGPEVQGSGRWLAHLTNCKVHSMPGAEGGGRECGAGWGQLAKVLADCGKEDFRFYSAKDLF